MLNVYPSVVAVVVETDGVSAAPTNDVPVMELLPLAYPVLEVATVMVVEVEAANPVTVTVLVEPVPVSEEAAPVMVHV